MPSRPPNLEQRVINLESEMGRVAKLETQMEEVLQKPAIRKRTEPGICALGIEPSEDCPSASLGKYQSGCHGAACMLKQADYFKEYRARKRAEAAANVKKTTPRKSPAATKVDPPTKRPVKRAKAADATSPPQKRIKRRAV